MTRRLKNEWVSPMTSDCGLILLVSATQQMALNIVFFLKYGLQKKKKQDHI